MAKSDEILEMVIGVKGELRQTCWFSEISPILLFSGVSSVLIEKVNNYFQFPK